MSDSALSKMEEGRLLQPCSTTNHRESGSTNDEASDQASDMRITRLANSIERKLPKSSPLPEARAIFKVPDINKEREAWLYEPAAVSIGPYYRGKEHLREMDQAKLRYLRCLLSPVSDWHVTLTDLVRCVNDMGEQARDCYREAIDLDGDDFLEMLILDGCFVVEIFRRDSHDYPIVGSFAQDIVVDDLIRVGNQIPWIVLQGLFDLTKGPNNNSSLVELANDFVTNEYVEYLGVSYERGDAEGEHPRHILDMLCKGIIAASKGELISRKKDDPVYIPRVKELVKAGVEFEMADSARNILDVDFRKGKLIIPCLELYKRTRVLLGSLVAYEQRLEQVERIHSSYAHLMGRLIKSNADVEYLQSKNIIDATLNPEDMVEFFGRIRTNTLVTENHYAKLCEDVNEYWKKRRHQWKAMLKNEYFENPWTAISVLAAITLLLLTLLQSICAVKEAWKL